MLLALVIDLGAEDVEAGAGAGFVVVGGLVEGELGVIELGVDGCDAGLVGDTEEVGVADGEDDEVAGILGGELGGLKVVLGGHVLLEGGEVDEVLGEVGAEVFYLKGSDDGFDARKTKAVGGKVDLLDGVGGTAGYGGQERLQAFKPLAAGLTLAGALEDEAEVVLEAALDGVVDG